MNNTLIFVVKYPVAGNVKTRLGQEIGLGNAVLLYRSFVEDLLAGLDEMELDVMIFYDPSSPIEKYSEWLGSRKYFPQQGKDIGERMLNCFENAFDAGYERSIIIGSDLPGLDMQEIDKGFIALQDNPACLGPAEDGGYYLIGFRKDRLVKSVFEGMKWSTDTVFEETVRRMNDQNIRPHILSPFSDVDTLDDLINLMADKDKKETLPQNSEYMGSNQPQKLVLDNIKSVFITVLATREAQPVAAEIIKHVNVPISSGAEPTYNFVTNPQSNIEINN